MRIAAIADVHGNSHALAAVLESVRRANVDFIAFLGDYVSDCGDPEGVVALVRGAAGEYPAWILKGNREEYMIDYAGGRADWAPSSRTGSLLYTAQRLAGAHIAWFRRLPISLAIAVEDCPPLRLCHGARHATRVLLREGSPELDQELRTTPETLALLGHSHRPFIVRAHGTLAVNPGSAALPMDGDTRAAWAIVEWAGGEWRAELRRAEYDVEGAVRQIEERGMSDMARWWARAIVKSLRTGANTTMPLLHRAYQLHEAGGREMEDCFDIAGRELGL